MQVARTIRRTFLRATVLTVARILPEENAQRNQIIIVLTIRLYDAMP